MLFFGTVFSLNRGMFTCIWVYKQIELFRFDKQLDSRTLKFWSLTGPVVCQTLFSILIESVAFIWTVSDPTLNNSKMEKHKKRHASKHQREKLTPYQGKKRSVGQFECCDCGKPWSSAYSWANTAQQCSACKFKLYPTKQVFSYLFVNIRTFK